MKCSAGRALSAQRAEQPAATATAAAVRGRARHATLTRLHEHPAGSAEADLQALARALADQRLQVHVRLQVGLEVARPRDGGLRVAERGRVTRLEEDGRAV